jgi:hypothetical protein
MPLLKGSKKGKEGRRVRDRKWCWSWGAEVSREQRGKPSNWCPGSQGRRTSQRKARSGVS